MSQKNKANLRVVNGATYVSEKYWWKTVTLFFFDGVLMYADRNDFKSSNATNR